MTLLRLKFYSVFWVCFGCSWSGARASAVMLVCDILIWFIWQLDLIKAFYFWLHALCNQPTGGVILVVCVPILYVLTDPELSYLHAKDVPVECRRFYAIDDLENKMERSCGRHVGWLLVFSVTSGKVRCAAGKRGVTPSTNVRSSGSHMTVTWININSLLASSRKKMISMHEMHKSSGK